MAVDYDFIVVGGKAHSRVKNAGHITEDPNSWTCRIVSRIEAGKE